MTPDVSAYIPVFNNAGTIEAAIRSIRAQSVPVAEILVIDDGSTDDSAAIAESLGARVIRLGKNMGRGAARARAMDEARHEFVLSCDATNAPDPDFLKNALPWFDDGRVAAVFGMITQPPAGNTVSRWRGRHLFKLNHQSEVRRGASLSTHGTIVRAAAVQQAGGYSPALRHDEDRDLGGRLLAAGWDVIYDPRLRVVSQSVNSLHQVFERYWRWNMDKTQTRSWREYARQVAYSVKVMAREDLRDGDIPAALISLLCPHYIFWSRSLRG
jgi:glycosyltransferase involved in cell wall biosynthesis